VSSKGANGFSTSFTKEKKEDVDGKTKQERNIKREREREKRISKNCKNDKILLS